MVIHFSKQESDHVFDQARDQKTQWDWAQIWDEVKSDQYILEESMQAERRSAEIARQSEGQGVTISPYQLSEK